MSTAIALLSSCVHTGIKPRRHGCAGRISVFADASAQTRAQGKKGGQWIYVTHGLADPSEVLQALHSYCGQANGARPARLCLGW